MKKFLTTALLAIVLVTSSFASGENSINYSVKTNFQKDFGKVSNVEWTANDNFSTATFVLNNKRTNAFYDNNAELIGTSHAITIDDLPASAKRVFLKKYTDYTLTEAIQFDSTNESSYFIAAKNDEKAIVFKISNGQVSIFK